MTGKQQHDSTGRVEMSSAAAAACVSIVQIHHLSGYNCSNPPPTHRQRGSLLLFFGVTLLQSYNYYHHHHVTAEQFMDDTVQKCPTTPPLYCSTLYPSVYSGYM